MNCFLKKALPQWRHNKKPSKWTDIEQISSFSKIICCELNWEASKLDRVLMIYGRDKVSRRRRNFYSVKVENYFWGRSAGFMLR
jgi:hypothetical protein